MRKVPTIFERGPGNRGPVRPEWHPACLWVRDWEGTATRKVDGQAVLVEDGTPYRRHMVKPDKAEPDGFRQVDDDPETGKRFGWLAVARDDPADRFLWEAFTLTRTLWGAPDGTYEAVGPKIQGGVERHHLYPDEHVLIPHTPIALRLYPEPPRTYEGLRGFLATFTGEGIVWHHPDGRWAKLKRKDY